MAASSLYFTGMTKGDHRDMIAKLRRDYTKHGFNEADALANPIDQFKRWFHEAVRAALPEPNAMTLATATRGGAPSARTVLLKDFDRKGFTFYTNYESRKGHELAKNPNVALVFFWGDLERQIRIEGKVRRIPRQTAAAYFASRPRDAQLGAWASQQSGPLPNRAALENEYGSVVARFAGKGVPLPRFWGGYLVVPTVFEFWQGRPNRLHDRILYRKVGSKW